MAESATKALEALRTFGEAGASAEEWRKAARMSNSTFYVALGELKDKDYVLSVEGTYYVVVPETTTRVPLFA